MKRTAHFKEHAKLLAKALPVAVDSALTAGKFLRGKFGKFKELHSKADSSFVTEADRGSERLVFRKIRRAFKNHTFIGEETGVTPNETGDLSEYVWHIDPLDGTTNFVHGFPIFCVSIGLAHVVRGPVLGVIYQPMTGDLYWATEGTGAFKKSPGAGKSRMSVSPTKDLTRALLSTGFSMRHEDLFLEELASFKKLAFISHSIRRTGSAAMDLTFVATGQFDGFWERGLSSWDVTAGLTLVREAGGEFSSLEGHGYRIGTKKGNTLLASNGKIHRQILGLFK